MREQMTLPDFRRTPRAVFVFAAFLFLTGGAQGTVATDRAALVALYNATDGPNWHSRDSWLSTDALYCNPRARGAGVGIGEGGL